MQANYQEGRQRVVISHVYPQVEGGRFAAKRIIGEEVRVEADIFVDGHSTLAVCLSVNSPHSSQIQDIPLKPIGNDRWIAYFTVESLGLYFYNLSAWVDHFESWRQDILKKFKAQLDISVDFQYGVHFIEECLKEQEDPLLRQHLTAIKEAKDSKQVFELATSPEVSHLMSHHPCNKKWESTLPHPLAILVDPPKARFSAWYELFPRSSSSHPGRSGTFRDCQKWLPYIADMGFDVLYLPPIHPIGHSKRRGKNNKPEANEEDSGSPWAIGSSSGGHKAIHPDLGSLEDLQQLIEEAKKRGIDVALDIAFQCSLDHPYLKEHPQWFCWRPDGTIQYAENPPKKYEDIVPFYFETDDWKALWEELKSIFVYWIEKGIKIFRVDNPHTKPFSFWEWLIFSIKQHDPDVIFLSEAFTRPQVMYWLSKLGFSQSYTYFAWRHTKKELIDYFTELNLTDVKEHFRPNLWPNTPDILTEELQKGNKAAFMVRLSLAATLSSNYGIYGPSFELMLQKAHPGTEEYISSEKYEAKLWNLQNPASLASFIAQINRIRKDNPALQFTSNLKFLTIDNDHIICYHKQSREPDNNLFIFVNLDFFHPQSGELTIPWQEGGLGASQSCRLKELLSGRYVFWEGKTQLITLDPSHQPVQIFRVEK